MFVKIFFISDLMAPLPKNIKMPPKCVDHFALNVILKKLFHFSWCLLVLVGGLFLLCVFLRGGGLAAVGDKSCLT